MHITIDIDAYYIYNIYIRRFLQPRILCRVCGGTEFIMDIQKVEAYIMANAKMFPGENIFMIRDKLLALSEDDCVKLYAMDFKDPTVSIVLSVLLGGLGIDRFYIGDTGMGVLKLLTGGLCGILTIYDWCTIMRKTREMNLQKFMMYI